MSVPYVKEVLKCEECESIPILHSSLYHPLYMYPSVTLSKEVKSIS